MLVRRNSNTTDAHAEWIPESTTYVIGGGGHMGDRFDDKAREIWDAYYPQEPGLQNYPDELISRIASALRNAAAEEREACAKIVEATTTFAEARGIISDDASVRECAQHTGKACGYVRQNAAAAIRARSEAPDSGNKIT